MQPPAEPFGKRKLAGIAQRLRAGIRRDADVEAHDGPDPHQLIDARRHEQSALEPRHLRGGHLRGVADLAEGQATGRSSATQFVSDADPVLSAATPRSVDGPFTRWHAGILVLDDHLAMHSRPPAVAGHDANDRRQADRADFSAVLACAGTGDRRGPPRRSLASSGASGPVRHAPRERRRTRPAGRLRSQPCSGPGAILAARDRPHARRGARLSRGPRGPRPTTRPRPTAPPTLRAERRPFAAIPRETWDDARTPATRGPPRSPPGRSSARGGMRTAANAHEETLVVCDGAGTDRRRSCRSCIATRSSRATPRPTRRCATAATST